jgi:hypothetical protein
MDESRPTLCPSCAQPMRLARITPRSGGLSAVETFECWICGVVLTQAQAEQSRKGNRDAN